MNTLRPSDNGFSLIELMVAMAIGLFLTGAVLSVYLAQSRSYKSTTSQASIQNAENAISALVTPVIRATGFNGCSTMTQALSHLVSGGPAPLGTQGALASMIVGYDAAGTAGSGSTLTISQANAINGASASGWSPSLESTLTGNVAAGSDVLVLLGAAPNSSPVGVTSIPFGSATMSLQTTSGLAAGQFGIVSDCLKASIFQITSVTQGTPGSISHAMGSGALANSADALAVNYPPGAQFVPLQQTAFYVAQGQGDQSVLMRATFGAGVWNVQPLVPGVESMQVLYGLGTGGIVNRYVAASAVTDWSQIVAVRLGFLVQGQTGSGSTGSTASRQFNVLGTTITVPADGRLRHVYEMTINMRNAA
ncbi:PilW family protein [Actimicrobium sp. CCC2.4]|uniref:PilW family protein n=1 Tax=Actimicrobium sp. CCC2.4 TaxID=3048606 RepID=UPI002AC92D0E|nr:PilW family protein [Actimicrobium sp. CCC2.4]MEB0135124.1 PilW family protein [Actimicrobium sp. CCC2.4]WPX31831.1 PilW family protein [Actimicrobium sp. CCC2.4]